MQMRTHNGVTRNRKFRFGLRALLIAVPILAAVCGYVAHELKIVYQRKAMLQEFVDRTRHLNDWRGCSLQSTPLIRRQLGDQSIGEFVSSEGIADEERSRLLSLFPEATVVSDPVPAPAQL